jgi:hypothetical protein
VPVVVTTARSENFGASLSATGTVVSRNDARIPGKLAAHSRGLPNRARGHCAAIRWRASTWRLALTLRDNEAVVKRLEAQLTLLATQRARLQSLGSVVSQSQLEEAQSRERMAERAWFLRAWRAIARLDLNRDGARAVRGNRRRAPATVRRICGPNTAAAARERSRTRNRRTRAARQRGYRVGAPLPGA